MSNIAIIANVLDLVGRCSGALEKQAILKKNEDVVGMKDVLKFIYNPYSKTGISNAKLSKVCTDTWTDQTVELETALTYFSNHKTGTLADVQLAAHFINYTRQTYGEPASNLARAIVTQDLKIGVTSTTLNKIFGASFIPKIGCMLGTKYGDVGPIKTKWPCIVTEKLDGIRRILVKQNGSIRMYSRSGHEDTGLVDILEDAKYLPNNRVYDGELLAKGNFTDNIALRQATSSIASSSGAKSGLCFHVFDMLPVEEFFAGKSEDEAYVRKGLLGATLGDESIQHIFVQDWPKYIASYSIHRELENIKAVPILGVVKNIDEATPLAEVIWKRGGEGVMLNTVDGFYEIKRSKSLLKVKLTKEYVLQVIGLQEGTGKFEDMLGALIVDYKGEKLGVGSGFTEDQRRRIWDNPDEYIDRMIEIDSFGESTNSAGGISLNCPIFKRFVGEAE